MKKNAIKIIIFGTLVVMLGFAVLWQNKLSPGLKINEVSFQNNDGNDWIEIYNPSLNAQNLKGLYLTDNKAEKTKFLIEGDIAINPKGFLVIGGQNSDRNEFVLKTNFGLKNGEILYLIAQNGVGIIDSLPLILEDENSNKTVGRFPDGRDDIFVFSTPTKGNFNDKDKLWEQR